VVSETLPESGEGTTVIRTDAVNQIRHLVKEAHGDVVLLAGGRLVTELVEVGVLKDIVLIVGTVFLGAGLPLLHEMTGFATSTLTNAKSYPPSTTWLRYRLD